MPSRRSQWVFRALRSRDDVLSCAPRLFDPLGSGESRYRDLLISDQPSADMRYRYRRTPGTTGAVRRNDRLLAAALYDRGVSVTVVENALILAASRRIFRPPDAVPLQPIRPLHYLLPVIDEMLQLHISQDYFRYLQFHIDRIQQKNTTTS
jgi:hypothetical protein